MFTNRCSAPFLISRSPRPVYRLSRSVITSASVAPSAETVFSPFVTGRRMVGTDTETLIKISSLCDAMTVTALVDYLIGHSSLRVQCRSALGARRRSPVHCNVGTGRNDFHRPLGHHAVDEPVGPKLRGVRRPGGHQHVVCLRFTGIGDVGPAGVGLGPGVGVI